MKVTNIHIEAFAGSHPHNSTYSDSAAISSILEPSEAGPQITDGAS